jgi:hypothetical protein
MLCGRGAFNVQSAGGVLSGELQWRKSDGVFHARTISTLTIASDGRSGSFTGIGDDGRPFEVYVEASGGKGSHDIFKLTVGGVLQTRSDGALAGGEIRICPDSVQAAL